MHLTLHLTQACNLACDYCYQNPVAGKMTFETAKQAIELLCKDQDHCGIIFFGGEPLLCKDLIFQIHDWCENSGISNFHYKITTNGLLLDEAFIQQATQRRIHIAMSLDGVKEAHDTHRVKADQSGSFDELFPKLKTLLEYQPYAPIMMTVSPDTIHHYAESVKWFQRENVNYLICSMDFSADWQDKDIKALKLEYQKLSDWHFENYRQEKKFYFSPFDKRISAHIFTDRTNSCQLGVRQISVDPDGTFFPCVQFVGHSEYNLGSIDSGFNKKRQCEIFNLNEEDRPDCSGCALENRCHNKCGCLNFQTTGNLQQIPVVLCEYERMLYPIADKLANKLFKLRAPMFIQRHYNTSFPVISFLEDMTT